MSHLLLRNGRALAWSIRLDRAPAWTWLALQCAALAPAWAWMAGRLVDGSDDPLGLLALLALGGLLLRERRALRASPRLGWLALALAVTLAATLLRVCGAPPLAAALVAVLAVACAMVAVLPDRVAVLPVLGLAVLALPLLSSLQFFVGYPLRVLTAETSRWLLSLGFSVSREGSSLLVDGRLVIVDAPCSGVQMVWFGYFTACAVSAWLRLADRTMALRLPAVGLCVLFANVLRNTVLVAAEGAGHPLAEWAHQAVGLLLLALVCTVIAAVMARPAPALPATAGGARGVTAPAWLANRFHLRVLYKAGFAAAMVMCVLWSGAQALVPQTVASAPQHAFEWPARWDGMPLRPQALGPVEARFARHFPGAIARLTDGRRVFVMRQVLSPSRMLHPAADCYRGLGYRVEQARLERDAQDRLWRCFQARRHGTAPLRVCERIVDPAGRVFTDTSDWYWAATAGRSAGPWLAVTVAEVL